MAEESNNAPEAAADGAQQAGPQFALQRIYLKDTSFESPKSPQIFQTQWSPKINFDIKTRNTKVADDVYEVVLVLTAEAQLEEETAFVVEVHQAGIFTVKEFSETDLEQVLQGAHRQSERFGHIWIKRDQLELLPERDRR